MKTHINLLLVFLLIVFSQKLNAKEIEITGNWSGKIDVQGTKLEIIFKLSRNDSGKLEGKFDVPQQHAANLPLGDIDFTGDSLKISVPSVLGSYAGKVILADSIIGKWKQAGQTFDLNLKKTGAFQALKRPQTPQAPFPYISENVEYTNPESGLKLAGTLTIPENAKACPAVVLITGSGAEDRDETIFEHKPFAVIADYFSRNGIAVLRVDDRGVGGSEGNTANSTSLDFAGDALAGVEFLKTQKNIDSSKIGLVGHSEGGSIAPLAATESKDVSFIVLMAGPGEIGEQILYEQAELINKANGMPEYAIEQNKLVQKNIFDVLKSEPDSAKAAEQLRNKLSMGMYNGMNDAMKKAVDTQIAGVNNAWFRYFLTYDPQLTLKKVKCPVLAINGSKDLQVPVSNLKSIIEAVQSGGNMNVDTMSFSNHNHMFQICETGTTDEYSQIEETIDPEVLKTMKDWILKMTSK